MCLYSYIGKNAFSYWNDFKSQFIYIYIYIYIYVKRSDVIIPHCLNFNGGLVKRRWSLSMD